MRLLPAALALALLLSNSVPGGGLSLESLLTNMRCKCIKSTAQVINLGLILAIDVTPPGIHCRRKEIILTLKKNKKVCVAPEAPWIQLLIRKLMQRNVTKKEVVARPRREAERFGPDVSRAGCGKPVSKIFGIKQELQMLSIFVKWASAV
ncbi:C-X-C motif chemokine 2-like [Pelecanus crispus]|uniref:C-X-C motif chemokine 2-like n=1 Tax=Pelecanus crispus TaxID=36300 RepID=UPI003F5D2CE8